MAPSIGAASPAAEAPRAAGHIVKVDPQQRRVTIAQEGIARLYIEPGTRIFIVRDPSLLTGLTPGDKVRFDVERDGRHYAITHLENAN